MNIDNYDGDALTHGVLPRRRSAVPAALALAKALPAPSHAPPFAPQR
jgi:hypothetical protein